jgi:chromosome segregation ATPase
MSDKPTETLFINLLQQVNAIRNAPLAEVDELLDKHANEISYLDLKVDELYTKIEEHNREMDEEEARYENLSDQVLLQVGSIAEVINRLVAIHEEFADVRVRTLPDLRARLLKEVNTLRRVLVPVLLMDEVDEDVKEKIGKPDDEPVSAV